MDPAELNEWVARMFNLRGINEEYVFYYDESNNIRRFRIVSNGFNIPDPGCFVLAGVGHEGGPRPLKLESIRPKLYLQPGLEELKLKHLAKGDFLSVLKSQRIATLLEWMEQQELFIHFQVIDPLYWSIVDIIDSAAYGMNFELGMLEARALKNALFTLVRDDPDGLSAFMARYDYPKVGDRGPEFMQELVDLTSDHLDWIHEEDIESHFMFMMLKGVLEGGRDAEELAFLKDEDPGDLIKEFGIFYANRIQTFANSEHILDEEPVVRDYLQGGALDRSQANYRFANSKSEEGIQLSDIVAGMLGQAFTYCTHTPRSKIADDIAGLSPSQLKSLNLLRHLIDRSVTGSDAFAHRVTSNEDELRFDLLLGTEAAG